jgi:hypothetical protein
MPVETTKRSGQAGFTDAGASGRRWADARRSFKFWERWGTDEERNATHLKPIALKLSRSKLLSQDVRAVGNLRGDNEVRA